MRLGITMSSDMSWQEYLGIFVDSTREMYEAELAKLGFGPEALLEISNTLIRRYLFLKPCQIYVFENPQTNQVAWFVTFEQDKPDKLFEVVEVTKGSLKDFLESSGKYAGFLEILDSPSEIKQLIADFLEFHTVDYQISFSVPTIWWFTSYLRWNRPEKLAEAFWSHEMSNVSRHLQRLRIEKSAQRVLVEAKIIRKARPSPALVEAEETIQKALENLKKIDDHEQKLMIMQNELTGVRKLVGTETFGEWKVLLSEIDKINTRIDSLNQIKEAYDKVLAQQTEVMKQQSSFVTWIKYATILVPVAVVLVPIIDALIRHFLPVS